MNDFKPKMRTIDQAYQCVRENDPETCLTKYALRQAVVTGRLPSVKCGKKYLVSLEILNAWLQGAYSPQEEKNVVSGIRRIDVRAPLRESKFQ